MESHSHAQQRLLFVKYHLSTWFWSSYIKALIQVIFAYVLAKGGLIPVRVPMQFPAQFLERAVLSPWKGIGILVGNSLTTYSQMVNITDAFWELLLGDFPCAAPWA